MKTNKNAMSKIAQIHKEQLSTQKVELGVVDDLNKTLNSSQTLEKEIIKINKTIGENRKLAASALKEQKKLKQIAEKASDKFRKLEREFETARQDSNRADKDYSGAVSSFKRFDENADRFVAKRKPLIKEATKNVSSFEKMITQAEKAAKDLGVKIPTASFSKMRDRLNKLIKTN